MGSDMDDLDKELAAIEGEAKGRMSALSSGSKVLPIAVAAIALIGFGVITYYAYNQGVRSGSEEAAPLLQPDGSAKVQPEDPGGLDIPHQDKLVYNRIDENVDDTRVERLLPQPEEPETPKLEDVTVEGEAQSAGDTVEQNVVEESQAVTRKGSDGQPRPPEPQSPQKPQLPEPELAEPKAPPAAAPMPESKPDTTVTETKVPAPEVVDLNKSWRIQISAVKSEESAKAEWAQKQKEHPGLLSSLVLQVQKIKVQGKGTFYRVRGGPLKDQNAARKLCADLQAKKVGCIVVKPGA